MSLLLFAARRKRTTLASILSKYSGSHLWDFGVSADKVAVGAGMTPAQFLAAYPNHNLYQDAEGTTPAFLPTHPVGLCLDQPTGSVVLGAELNSNPGPFTATTGYTAGTLTGGALPTLSIVSSLLRVTTVETNYGVAEFSFPTVVRKTYQVILGVSTISTGDKLIYRIGSTVQGYDYADASLGSGATPSDYKRIFTATGTTCYVTFGNYATPLGSFTEFNKVTVKEVLGSHASQTNPVKRPKLEARYNMLLATATLSTQSVTTLAASYKLTFTGSGTVTLSGTYVGSLVGGGSLTFTATAGTLTLTITGSVTVADLRPANSPTNIPAYQRVTSATDYDTVGFPLRAVWDGVDDGNSTGAVTLTSSMDLFVVMRRDSEAQLLITHGDTGNFVGACVSGLGSSACNGVGSGYTLRVDGVTVADTRDALNTAMSPNKIHLFELLGGNFSAWSNFKIGDYSGYQPAGPFADVVLVPSMSDADRVAMRNLLATKNGVTL